MADAAALATLLEGYSLDASTELALQDGIASALTDADVAFEREVRLDAGSRPDFMVGGVAIEVKVGGSWAALVGGPELSADAGEEHAATVDLHGEDFWPSSRQRREWVA